MIDKNLSIFVMLLEFLFPSNIMVVNPLSDIILIYTCLFSRKHFCCYTLKIKGCNTEKASSVFLLLGHPVRGADVWE